MERGNWKGRKVKKENKKMKARLGLRNKIGYTKKLALRKQQLAFFSLMREERKH